MKARPISLIVRPCASANSGNRKPRNSPAAVTGRKTNTKKLHTARSRRNAHGDGAPAARPFAGGRRRVRTSASAAPAASTSSAAWIQNVGAIPIRAASMPPDTDPTLIPAITPAVSAMMPDSLRAASASIRKYVRNAIISRPMPMPTSTRPAISRPNVPASAVAAMPAAMTRQPITTSVLRPARRRTWP